MRANASRRDGINDTYSKCLNFDPIALIADYHSIDVERIITLHPDLVIAWERDPTEPVFQQLQAAGIAVYYSDSRQLTGISTILRNMGCLAGTSAIADTVADQFEQKYAAIKNRYATAPKKSVFIQINDLPLMTVSARSFIHEAIGLCGTTNPFASLPGVAPLINREAVIQANPDVLLAITQDRDWLEKWKLFSGLSAVTHQRLWRVDPDLFARPTPRLLDAIAALCAELQTSFW